MTFGMFETKEDADEYIKRVLLKNNPKYKFESFMGNKLQSGTVGKYYIRLTAEEK